MWSSTGMGLSICIDMDNHHAYFFEGDLLVQNLFVRSEPWMEVLYTGPRCLRCLRRCHRQSCLDRSAPKSWKSYLHSPLHFHHISPSSTAASPLALTRHNMLLRPVKPCRYCILHLAHTSTSGASAIPSPWAQVRKFTSTGSRNEQQPPPPQEEVDFEDVAGELKRRKRKADAKRRQYVRTGSQWGG